MNGFPGDTIPNVKISILQRFPTDVIILIISYLQADIPKQAPSWYARPNHMWLRASYICRLWRAVTLSTPSLWNNILLGIWDTVGPLECLRRSQDTPFTLYFDADLPSNDPTDMSGASVHDALINILAQSSRLRRIHIISYWKKDTPFWNLLDVPAPMLDSLAIDLRDEHFAGDQGGTLPRIFGDKMPALKNVYLSNISSWPHSNFRKLVRLHLRDQDYHSRPHLTTFLRMLEASSTTLQELVICNAGPVGYRLQSRLGVLQVPTDVAPVHLPALHTLEISRYQAHISRYLTLLLEHIILPPTTRCCFLERQELIEPSEYFPHRGAEGHRLETVTIKRLALTSFSEAHPSLCCCIGRSGANLYADYGRITPRRLFKPGDFLESVEELIYVPSPLWSNVDGPLLGALPSLHKLKITTNYSTRIYRTWEILQEQVGDGPTARMKYAPLLETLHVDFNEPGTGYTASKQVEPLIETLEIRRRSGSPIKQLILSGFLPDHVTQFHGHIDNVLHLEVDAEDHKMVARKELMSEFEDFYSKF